MFAQTPQPGHIIKRPEMVSMDLGTGLVAQMASVGPNTTQGSHQRKHGRSKDVNKEIRQGSAGGRVLPQLGSSIGR